jgi:uncharacterized membrane protein (UPF0182 family)
VPQALANCPDVATCEPEGTLRPYYVLFKLPRDDLEQFVLFQPFQPSNRANMVGYVAAGSDPAQYGRLNVFEFPAGEIVDGPQLVRNKVNQDPLVSPQISLLGQKGSDVQFGDLIIVPIEDGFLYVQPIFVRAKAANAIPELKKVVVVHGDTVTISDTLAEALAATFGEEAPPPTTGGGPPPTGRVARLLQQALDHFQQAQEFLRQGDLAGYQREIDAAEDLVRQARAASESSTATPSPTATPTG